MSLLSLLAKAKPAIDDGGASFMGPAMGFFVAAFLVAIIASVVSSAFASARNSADVSISNAKKISRSINKRTI
ncbi:hypothetical protein HH197_16510 [Citrobacter koseri]|uniref:hypothetical protein n=1 Tax=Citrobacter koseri TaxID=545 RepID=UPI0014636C24|nr:hypothetical protein [Citrobacter koseri]QJI79794.1 hypothetical protein HH197_16510 [Citrobacter koseri]